MATMRRRIPSFLLESVGGDYPRVHLFDEPQFNTQDGYIGFMLDVFDPLDVGIHVRKIEGQRVELLGGTMRGFGLGLKELVE